MFRIALISLALPIAVANAQAKDPRLAAHYDSVGASLMAGEHYKQARDSLELAARLDPTRATVATRLGTIAIEFGDFAASQRWLAKARALDSASLTAVYWTAASYLLNGDEAGARPYVQQLAKLPGSATRVAALDALSSLAAGRSADAAQAAARLLTANGSMSLVGHLFSGEAALFAGKLDEAKPHFEAALAADAGARNGPTGHYATTSLAYILRKLGNTNESDALLQKSMTANHARLAEGRDSQGYPYDIASVYAIQGNNAEALKWLSKAVDAGWRKSGYTQRDPLLAGIRGEAEFRRIITRMETLSRARSADSIDQF
jgi:tetratricopeptide (TPR) repeat protein